jgi:hypothetical protein|tara:strand:- start:308 stop:625 length:318 start_codon:yes stop_codon:yes gene_type:complete
MTDKSLFKDMIEDAEPENVQIGGSHYMYFNIQPYEFISKNNLSFFQGCVVKYVCRYMHKNGVEDLNKIIHYCELEKKKLQDSTPEEKETWAEGYKKWKEESEDTI